MTSRCGRYVVAAGLLFMAVLLASPVQARTPASEALEDEALCDLLELRSLVMSASAPIRIQDGDQVHLNESDFRPLPCKDGSRPQVPGPGWVSGCHFAYRMELSGSAYAFVALGVSARSQGLEFRVGKREGVEGRDCQQVWRRRDPVWRWREVEQEVDCCMRQDLDAEPRCRAAIRVLAQAYAAGLAREDFNQCPAAQDLHSRARQSPAQKLCGPSSTRNERVALARGLAQKGMLMRALAADGCSPEAFRLGLPLLERGLARQCRTGECLTALERASQVDAAATRRLAGREARVLLPLLEARVRETREPEALMPLLSGLLGLDTDATRWLALLLTGTVSTDARLGTSLPWAPESPLLVSLLESVRSGSHSPSASVAEVLLERLGRARASPQAFAEGMAAVPCVFFSQAGDVPVEAPGRLAAVAAQADRCWDSVQAFEEQLTRMEPSQLVQELSRAPCRALEPVGPRLGWEDAERAAVLFPWLAKQCPHVVRSLLAISTKMPLRPHLVRLAFVPGTLEAFGGKMGALGGKRVVLQSLFSHSRDELRAAGADVSRELAKGVASEPPDVVFFSNAWRLPLPHAELREIFQGPLRSPSASIRAAAAGAMANAGASDIPEEAARACLGEMREYVACHAPGLAAAGPIPNPGAPLPERKQWCSRFRAKPRDCSDRVCGYVSLLDERARKVLSAATGEESPDVRTVERLFQDCVLMIWMEKR
ncbi:hypothetical protein BO221_03175 [Archangium sp. Cb G35]|uniref:hypothetical protein n=1 Tax=Archangium sp. Cb G35 TaxID=1920190 RepID=UPI000935D104|nr:hypothetical protein [Archangium sp. Cb G35]OJT27017.1 hypothetical protein BO221_03175 [Archangium sp. Cb G35]